MSTPRYSLVVVSGGLSEESATHRLGDALAAAVVERGKEAGVVVTPRRIAIRDLAQEIASASITGFAAGELAEAYDAVADADAVIAVSPTYKASFTGLFKAFWDVTPDGIMSGVPVILGATGGSPRHSLMTDTALRTLFAYMKACVAPTGIYVAAEDWGQRSLEARIGEAADELVRALGFSTPPAPPARDAGEPGESEDAGQAPTVGRANLEELQRPNARRTLAGTRSRARDPFTDVPTMEDMLKR
ncbi:CE1759 family FMN reductase [Falsarthrobacter nasiphocae]|uniref:FMN reductase n=1 Tax=Falsarthrobacter nasiphocae TaxID=189863 RepID=A0AAE4C6I4_9MICC|nr:CE1759 family FMN reductase [Falsarthrobacter nasiphocae]MDR6892613.1 FMN reductase [Falsarthrobacter nasiphocae]